MEMKDSDKFPVPGTMVGGYRLLSPLAQGGNGMVFLAVDADGHRVVVKFGLWAGAEAWVRREVSILNELEHPNIVSFLGCGRWPTDTSEGFYLVMRYVEGPTLDRWLREQKPSARRLVRVALLPITRALEATHAAGVVHRDVKPSNVLISVEQDEAVLVDFGLGAKPGAPPLTPRERWACWW